MDAPPIPRLVDLVHAFNGVVVEQFKKIVEKLLSDSVPLWRLLELLFKFLESSIWPSKKPLFFCGCTKINFHFRRIHGEKTSHCNSSAFLTQSRKYTLQNLHQRNTSEKSIKYSKYEGTTVLQKVLITQLNGNLSNSVNSLKFINKKGRI